MTIQEARSVVGSGKSSLLSKRKSKIIEKGQQESGDLEIDGTAMSALKAVDDYLNRPLCDDTFEFWKMYSKSADKTQQCLSKLARHYLTPPPTTTDVERLVGFKGSP